MKSHAGFAIALVFTALFAGYAGWRLSRSDADARIDELEARLDTFRRESTKGVDPAGPTQRSGATATGRQAPPLNAAEGGPAVVGSKPDEASAAIGEEPTLTHDEKFRRVREIRGAVDGWFDAGDGKAALAALVELAEMVPEGRDAAMELAIRINADVSGPGELKLDQMTFYTSLAAPAIRELMTWSLASPSPAGFREMSAYSLPWIQPREKTIEMFVKTLAEEREGSVQRALIWNLSQMRSPEAEAALSEIMTDAKRPAAVRAEVMSRLARSDNADIVDAIESAAAGDPDPVVQAAARAALNIRNPPATGYMVTGTLPNSQAAEAGMKVGDILVSYGEKSVRTLDDLRTAASGQSEAEAVSIVVIRDGQEVTLALRPGKMGIYGENVKARDD